MAFDFHAHWKKSSELLRSSIPFVTVTLVDMRGSAPQIQGAKAIVTLDGIAEGTVGGGKVEAKAIAYAIELLQADDGRSCDLVTWNLQTDVGMTCGGEVKFFFEVFSCNDWKIAIFGAGHVSQALIPILLPMNCQITWLDPRSSWLAKLSDHSRLTKVCVANPHEYIQQLDERSFFVLVTQGHATDLPILAEILINRRPSYVGVLGSSQKAKVLQRDLKARGLADEVIQSYFCPMGLPLGNNTPAEIAVSIAAQLIQRRDELGILKHRTKVF
jgi:xanthine dehydrogenase accessory factor